MMSQRAFLWCTESSHFYYLESLDISEIKKRMSLKLARVFQGLLVSVLSLSAKATVSCDIGQGVVCFRGIRPQFLPWGSGGPPAVSKWTLKSQQK